MRVSISRKGMMNTGLFVLSYLLFLIAQMPLNIVMAHIPLPKDLTFSGVTGTPWQGAVREVRWQRYEVHNLRWQVQWSSLLLGKPAIELTLHDPELIEGSLIVGYRTHFSVTAADLKAPADKLATLSGMPLPVSVSGMVNLKVTELDLTPTSCLSLEGQVRWSKGQVDSPMGTLPLGEPQMTLACENNQLLLKASQDSEAISSQSTLTLALNGRYQLQSTLTPGKQFPEGLSALLKMGASDLGNGVYKLNESGQI